MLNRSPNDDLSIQNTSFFIMCVSVIVNLQVGNLDRRGLVEEGDRLDRLCRWIFPMTYFGLLLFIFWLSFFLTPLLKPVSSYPGIFINNQTRGRARWTLRRRRVMSNGENGTFRKCGTRFSAIPESKFLSLPFAKFRLFIRLIRKRSL